MQGKTVYVIRNREGEEQEDPDSPPSRVLRPRTSRPNYALDSDDDEEYEPPHPRVEVQPYRKTILDQDWSVYYKRCPMYQDSWAIVTGEAQGPLHVDVKIYGNKMYF
jgi:hypothetical protein